MKILLISPYFAPYTGVGGLRMTSLAAYLQKAGEEVTVVKLADTCYPADQADGPRPSGVSYVDFVPAEEDKEPEKTLYPVLDRLCTETAFDCCLVSFGPFYTVRPAIYIKEHYQIPLVADYRDLWLYHDFPKKSLRIFLGRCKEWLLHHRQEASLMAHCSAFVNPSLWGERVMQKHYPVLKEKSALILNGYNMPPPAGTEASAPLSSSEELRICILGKFFYYSPAGTQTFFSALTSLLAHGVPIHVYHIGTAEAVQSLLDTSNFPQNHYHELGSMPYEQALSAAQQAHICAIISGGVFGYGTKAFDYIYLNKPIIAYTPENSELVELLKDAENAYVCQTAAQMKAAIEAVIQGGSYQLTKNLEYRQRFSRETQNRIYHQLLQKTAGQQPGKDKPQN